MKRTLATLMLAATVTACGTGVAAQPSPPPARSPASHHPATARPAACVPVMRAVDNIATRAGINLIDGTWHGTLSRAQRLTWAAELTRSYPAAGAPTKTGLRLQEKVITASLQLSAVTGNRSALKFIHKLQAIAQACA